MAEHGRKLQAIDRQLAALSECQRRWRAGGTSAISEAEVFAEIDRLLAERHELMVSQGELRHPDDIATVSEWGQLG